MKTLIITGSRNYTNPKPIFDALDEYHRTIGVSLLVNGGCKGADRFAEDWAVANDIPVETIPAQWAEYGLKAGMVRNREMLDLHLDAHVVAFPLGASPGTRGCVKEALKRRMPTTVYEIS